MGSNMVEEHGSLMCPPSLYSILFCNCCIWRYKNEVFFIW